MWLCRERGVAVLTRCGADPGGGEPERDPVRKNECLWVQEEDTVISLAVSPDGATVAVGWRSLLVRQYQWESGPNPSRQWKVLQLVLHK